MFLIYIATTENLHQPKKVVVYGLWIANDMNQFKITNISDQYVI